MSIYLFPSYQHQNTSYPDSAMAKMCVRASVRPGSKNSTYYPGYLGTLVRRGAVIETGVEETHIQIFTGFFLHALFILQGQSGQRTRLSFISRAEHQTEDSLTIEDFIELPVHCSRR